MAHLHIPKPCHEPWSVMTPAASGRHCATCDTTVVDVTRMAPAEAARFLGEVRSGLPRGDTVCVRAHADPSGRLLSSSATRRLLTNGLAAVISMTMAGCHGEGPKVGASAPATGITAGTRETGATTPTPTPSGTDGPSPIEVGSVRASEPLPIQGDVTCVEETPTGGIPAVRVVTTGQLVAAPRPAPATADPAPVPADPPGVMTGKPRAR